jgi:nitrate reductase molybdenum cofactor assembly chaperone NarJ/NarW
MMSARSWIADALEYPAPGRLQKLQSGLDALPAGTVKTELAAFVRHIEQLSLGEWEELHTRTLDLNPPAAPYVGYQTWGESYARGEFMAQMSQALASTGIDPCGELPDHLAPVLRYLDRSSQPLPELATVLKPSIQRMLAVLQKAEPQNPYCHLLHAAVLAC